jgi:hypothetical protein
MNAPRTDNIARGNHVVPTEWAEELEYELTAARAKTTHYKAVAQKAMDDLIAVTERRNEARRLAEKYRNLSCDSQEEADETLLPWETTNPNEL